MSAGVGVCDGRSNSSLMDCVSICSKSHFSVLLSVHDTQFVKKADKVVVSCRSMSTDVPHFPEDVI